ncbi:hypothetical protein HGRIS_008844 [Hohenbuehelia grisea]|uniref:Uncharacterized protein n=1 Tax=Hohenbuehelia grisea TaxID=104357 RepID=A0ABR3IZB3_9AGAR
MRPQFNQINDDEEDMEVEEEHDMEALAAFVSYAQEQAHKTRVTQRNATRRYLCHSQLLPNPRINTPWQRLYESRSDRAFITTMGFDVETFEDVLRVGFGERWYTRPIPRVMSILEENPDQEHGHSMQQVL